MESVNSGINSSLLDPSWIPDHPASVQGSRRYEGFIKAMDHYVTPAICAFGCIGNLLNLVVLNRRKFRRSDGGKETSAHLGLTYLAVSDMSFCIALFPRFLLNSHNSVFESRNFLLYYQMYGTGLITTFILVSTWIIVTMAMLRYLAICYPLRVRAMSGPKFTKVLYTSVMLLCIMINLPSFWQYKLSDLGLQDMCCLVDIGYMDNTQLRGQAFLWVRVIVGTFIPVVILISCNWSLIRALQQSYRMRQQYHVNQNSASSKNRITLMLVIIVTTFVIFVFPCELMEFFMEIVRQDAHKTEFFLLFRSLANLLQTVNFTFNFVLYCLINAHFRSEVFALFLCGRCKHKTQSWIYKRTSTLETKISNHSPLYGSSQHTSARKGGRPFTLSKEPRYSNVIITSKV